MPQHIPWTCTFIAYTTTQLWTEPQCPESLARPWNVDQHFEPTHKYYQCLEHWNLFALKWYIRKSSLWYYQYGIVVFDYPWKCDSRVTYVFPLTSGLLTSPWGQPSTHLLQGFSHHHEVSLLQGKFTGKEKKFDAPSDLIDLCGPRVCWWANAMQPENLENDNFISLKHKQRESHTKVRKGTSTLVEEQDLFASKHTAVCLFIYSSNPFPHPPKDLLLSVYTCTPLWQHFHLSPCTSQAYQPSMPVPSYSIPTPSQSHYSVFS